MTSAFEQTYKNIEVICINDGSTDGTLLALNDLKAEIKGDLIVLNQENQGASAARNIGLEIAKGDYIQFLDGDDYLLENKIQVQMDIALQNNQPDIIVGGCKAYDEDDKFLFDRKYKEQASNNIWLMLLKTDLGNTCANLFKSEYFKNGGKWDTSKKSSQDYNMMFDMLKSPRTISFDDQLNTILVRRTSDSISHVNVRENWIRHLELRIRILSHLEDKKNEVPLQEAYQIVFDAIRILYQHDKDLAYEYYQKIIPKKFSLKVSVTSGRAYVFIFKLLGFRKAEKLKSIFRRVRHQKVTYG